MLARLSASLLAVAGAAIVAVAGFSMPAAASFCGVTIGTAWSAADTDVAFTDTSFVACSTTRSGLSGFSGTRTGDFPGDTFTFIVEAVDEDTFGISLSVTDTAESGQAFTGPDVVLELTNINWFGQSGMIDNVIDNSIAAFADFDVTSFTADSITLTGTPGEPFGAGCPNEIPGCEFNFNLGTFDVIASHRPIPEPGTLALLGFGLAGLAGLGSARRRRAA